MFFYDKDKYFHIFLPKEGDNEFNDKNIEFIIKTLKSYSLRLAEGFILMNFNDYYNRYDIIFIDTDREILSKIKQNLEKVSKTLNIQIKDEYLYSFQDINKFVKPHAYLLIDKNFLYYAHKK